MKQYNLQRTCGKSTVGIVTGNFDNVSQVHNVLKSGGIIDTVSESLGYAINQGVKHNLIPSNVGTLLKKGKNVIVSTIESKLENEYNEQLNSIELLSKYELQWKNYFNRQDFDGMEREYQKIKNIEKIILPTKNTISQIEPIKNLHNLIKNNGQNFNLSEEEIELSKKLVV